MVKNKTEKIYCPHDRSRLLIVQKTAGHIDIFCGVCEVFITHFDVKKPKEAEK